MSKSLKNLFVAVLCFAPFMASADANFRCHGRSYETGFFFKYEVELHDQGPSRTRLSTSAGYGESMDYGWREIPQAGSKIAVDSPYHEYKAFLSRQDRSYELILVDPVTSVPVVNPPYDRFVCISPL